MIPKLRPFLNDYETPEEMGRKWAKKTLDEMHERCVATLKKE